MHKYETVTASAPSTPRASSGGAEGKLESVRIEVLENGFTVTCGHKDPPRKKNEPYSFKEPPKYAFGDAEGVLAFVSKKLGAKSEGKKHEAAEGEK